LALVEFWRVLLSEGARSFLVTARPTAVAVRRCLLIESYGQPRALLCWIGTAPRWQLDAAGHRVRQMQMPERRPDREAKRAP
jgi:hypothetical protein